MRREHYDCGMSPLKRLWSHLGMFPAALLPPCLPLDVYSGHKSAVTCVQFDDGGTRLVSGSKVSVIYSPVTSHDHHTYQDTTVVVWDVVGGCGLYRLRGHKAPITGCRWLNRANTLLTTSKDCLVKLWDLETQHCFQTLVGHKSEVIITSLFERTLT